MSKDEKNTCIMQDDDTLQQLVLQLSKDNDKLKEDSETIKTHVQLLQEENQNIKKENQATNLVVKQLREELEILQKTMTQELNSHDERHATILSELNGLKESIMDSNSLNNVNYSNNNNIPNNNDNVNNITSNNIEPISLASSSSMRSIPAPSKVMVDDQKKKDNRLVELRRITKECMNVDDEEAGLRLYKLQKTMVHVVSDLKKYMRDRNEDISKSWKSIDISTQRVAFEMVEREASSLGVPLNMCIGYWGARRLISKSWANALRTTKKHIKSGGPEETKYEADGGGGGEGVNSDDLSDNDTNRINKKPKLT